MAELNLSREFDISADDLWHRVTNFAQMPLWFGRHNGMKVIKGNLGLAKLGPWDATFGNDDGAQISIAGEVLEVSYLMVAFTWAWVQRDGSTGSDTLVEMSIDPITKTRAMEHQAFGVLRYGDCKSSSWRLVCGSPKYGTYFKFFNQLN